MFPPPVDRCFSRVHSGPDSLPAPRFRSKIGLPVPAGFTITCETCIEYQKCVPSHHPTMPALLTPPAELLHLSLAQGTMTQHSFRA
jgi:hypothetical protein